MTNAADKETPIEGIKASYSMPTAPCSTSPLRRGSVETSWATISIA